MFSKVHLQGLGLKKKTPFSSNGLIYILFLTLVETLF